MKVAENFFTSKNGEKNPKAKKNRNEGEILQSRTIIASYKFLCKKRLKKICGKKNKCLKIAKNLREKTLKKFIKRKKFEMSREKKSLLSLKCRKYHIFELIT